MAADLLLLVRGMFLSEPSSTINVLMAFKRAL